MKRTFLSVCLGVFTLLALIGCGKQETETAVYRDGKGKKYTCSINFFKSGKVAVYNGDDCLRIGFDENRYIGNPLKDGWIVSYEMKGVLNQNQLKESDSFAQSFLAELNKYKLPKEIKTISDKKEWMKKTVSKLLFDEDSPLHEKYEETKELMSMNWPFIITNGKLLAVSENYPENLMLVKQKKAKRKVNSSKRNMNFKNKYGYFEIGTDNIAAEYDLGDNIENGPYYFLGNAYKDGWVILTNVESKKSIDKEDFSKLESAMAALNKIKIPTLIKSADDYQDFVSDFCGILEKQGIMEKDESQSVFFEPDDIIEYICLVQTLPSGEKILILNGETTPYIEAVKKK